MRETTTVFNQHLAAKPRHATTDAEPPVQHICIVGGGTSGWMTALMLANTAYGPRLKVTVIESPQVGTIGVGEGSTPWLRGFFDELGIEESEWMPACNATYKAGNSFEHWSTKPGFERYFHPFASTLDNMTMQQFTDNVHARLEGANVHAHPDRFFVAAAVARQARGPRAEHHFPFDLWYGYHFDATLLGQFLRGKAIERGVRHLQRHVSEVVLGESGDIERLRLADDESIAADFFVDCSGFASVLLGQALETPFDSFSSNLFNDSAIAMPSELRGPIRSHTTSTALRHGWAWKIPLTSRYGNGYVYSSAHCSADQAETELRQHLGLLDSDTPALHLKMRVGCRSEMWRRNCVGVGLSQGFIEPLEATALLLVQRTVAALVDALEQGAIGQAARDQFNAYMRARLEYMRDYIVAHYKTNSRTDTDYWRQNAENMNLSESLQRVLMTWMARKPLVPELRAGRIGHGWPIMSWYTLLAGVGIFPEVEQASTPQQARHDMEGVDDLVMRSALNFPDHRELLAAIPPRVGDKTLQIYLW